MRSFYLASIALHAAPGNAEGIPDFLRRAPSAPSAAQAAPAAVVAKAAPEPKVKKAKAAPKAKTGKVVKAKHKPSEVTATEQNPQKSIVPVRFKERYADTGDSCGDRVALALKHYTTGKNADGRPCCDVAKLQEVAKANGLDWAAYAKMNVGQQRMNIGNRLRGMLKNEQPVTIGKQRFADWEKAKIVDKSAWAKEDAKAAA